MNQILNFLNENKSVNELQSSAEVVELEKQLDKMMATLGLDVEFSRHFIERILAAKRKSLLRRS